MVWVRLPPTAPICTEPPLWLIGLRVGDQAARPVQRESESGSGSDVNGSGQGALISPRLQARSCPLYGRDAGSRPARGSKFTVAVRHWDLPLRRPQWRGR